VVGVGGDVKQMGLEAAGREEMYIPYTQTSLVSFFSPKDLAIRTAGDPMRLADAVREAIWRVDPLQPVSNVRPMEALLEDETSSRSEQTSLLGGFAALALVLAYTVAQRRRELGIRMALGASAGEVVRMVVRQGLTMWAVGIGIGAVAALAMTRALAALLFGVSATDPATFAAVALVLGAVSLLASYVPARQAARVDPMIALRSE